MIRNIHWLEIVSVVMYSRCSGFCFLGFFLFCFVVVNLFSFLFVFGCCLLFLFLLCFVCFVWVFFFWVFFAVFFGGGGGVPIVFGLSWLPHRFSLRFIYYLQSVLCIVCTMLPMFSRLSILDCSLWLSLTVIVQYVKFTSILCQSL